MPSISFDGRSLMIDGRRIWLVSGSIHYARVARGLWRKRILSAKHAGLNCICTDVFWSVHETEPGEFSFEDEADLRHFVQLIGAEGMYCILRPGPYVGASWDLGGLPPWLTTIPGVTLRQSNPAAQGFLEASARFLGAVMEQVKDLQLTAPAPPDTESTLPGGGPIVMMQAEHAWFCHHPAQAQTYLGEIVRYLRENGCEVPIIVGNNFWQRVDGAFDTWSADEHLATDLRQMRLVQPEAPRFVSEVQCGQPDHWGEPHEHRSAAWCLNRLGQILSAGAQYNVHMFHGGTNFGFNGGCSDRSRDALITTSHDCGAPLSEAGDTTPMYWAVKRISMFASQFGQVLAHLEPDTFHAAVAPLHDSTTPGLIHLRGAQGDALFAFMPEANRPEQVQLMLPDGLTLPVPVGQDRLIWLLLKANLGGVAELTYSNLRPWAFIASKLLVLFGPAGADGLIGINDAPLAVTVPAGRSPLVETHEDLTIVVLNDQTIDAATATRRELTIGSAGLDEHGEPITIPGWASTTTVRANGRTHAKRVTRPRRPSAPRLTRWLQAPLDQVVDGTSQDYRTIEGPAGLEALSAPFGYGWYRLTFPAKLAAHVMVGHACDRLHLFAEGKPLMILGSGAASRRDPMDLRISGQLVVLADNSGRFDDGWLLGEHKGLYGHLYEVKPVRLGRPQAKTGPAPDPFDLGGYFRGMRQGERPAATSLSWRVKSIGSQPLIVDIQDLPFRAMLIVNGTPVGLYDPQHTAGTGRYLLEFGPHLRRRPNEICLALFEEVKPAPQVSNSIKAYQATGNVTAKAQWAFANWSMPSDQDFGPPSSAGTALPSWYRSTFNTRETDGPLWLEPSGISKGQIYLNDHNIGRYFVDSPTRKKMGPQKRYYLPEPWLRNDGPNVLTLFDEHGKNPTGCRLVYSEKGAFG